MTTRLAKRLQQAVARSKLNYREIADAAGVPYGWVRQVAAGGIGRPGAERLKRLAAVLPIEADELLALSDQLGASAEVGDRRPETGDLVDALNRQSTAIENQTATMERLLNSFAARFDQFGAERERDFRALVQGIGELLAPIVPAKDQSTTGGSDEPDADPVSEGTREQAVGQ